jgi:transcriptional regulator with XRE-family HTH domain
LTQAEVAERMGYPSAKGSVSLLEKGLTPQSAQFVATLIG